MITGEYHYTKPSSEVFKSYIRTLFANSAIHLTDLEVDILDQVKKSRTGFSSKNISTNLNISVQSLNNYKSKLVKKNLLIKATDDRYYVNPKFNISNVEKEMELILKFKFED